MEECGEAKEKRERMEGAKLIPGLPDEIAELCLLRVPHIYHYTLCRVSQQWKNLVDGPSFLSIRKELGFSNTSLFLLGKKAKEKEKEMEMRCWHVDLDTYDCISSHFPIQKHHEIFEGPNYVCVGVGSKVLLIENNHSPAVYLFNTHSGEWERGPDMRNPRLKFAYGVIEDRLYVAHGFQLESSEVFDPHSNAWLPIANLPLSMCISQFFVYEKSLFVIGCGYQNMKMAFSYNPLRDEWQEQPWVLDAVGSLQGSFITAPTEEECLYGLLPGSSEEECLYRLLPGSSHLSSSSRKSSVFRYEKIMSKWEPVLSFTEQIPVFHPFIPSKGSCRGSFSTNVKACGLKDKVLILQHFNDDDPKDKEEDGLMVSPPTPEDKVVKVFVGCPDEWNIALLHA